LEPLRFFTHDRMVWDFLGFLALGRKDVWA